VANFLMTSSSPQNQTSLPATPEEDRALIDRCLAGDSHAWELLYHSFHHRLLVAIRVMLPRVNSDPNLVEEIAARVWYAVVTNDGELLGRFDPERDCRLSTMLSVVAKSEIGSLYRTERRRHHREAVASRPDSQFAPDSQTWLAAELGEFMDTLTRGEKAFCADVLLSLHHQSRASYTETNRWKLTSRIKGKLGKYVSSK
jgi:hypothetical protein